MLAVVEGQVVRIQPGEVEYPARPGRPGRKEKYVEVTMMQTVPNPYEVGKTDMQTVAVRVFNNGADKCKVGEKGSLPCVIRGFTSGGKVQLAADSR